MNKEEGIKMDEEELEIKTEVDFLGIQRNMDYATILFALSRSNREKREQETEYTVIIERAWAGDVSKYIVELENKILELTRKKEEYLSAGLLSQATNIVNKKMI